MKSHSIGMALRFNFITLVYISINTHSLVLPLLLSRRQRLLWLRLLLLLLFWLLILTLVLLRFVKEDKGRWTTGTEIDLLDYYYHYSQFH